MNLQKINQQLVFLFLCNFAILFTGMGLFPVLPLYAARFGATTTQIGLYLAITYISITAGTMLTGWLAGRVARKHLFLAAGLLGMPALIAMGYAVNFPQAIILTSIVWLTGGIGLAMVSVFTGLAVDQKKSGKAFSLQSLASPVGAIFGGFAVGWLVEWQGYPLMFAVLAAIWAIWPVLAIWKIKDREEAQTARPRSSTTSGSTADRSQAFLALLAAILLAAITVSVGRLGLSLVMKAQSFSLSAISSTSMVGGLVSIPFVALTGSTADRIGHRRTLVLGYLVASVGALILIFASQLWQFWLASILLLVALNSNRSLATATAAGMLAPGELANKLPWTATAHWSASIIGFAASGFIIEAAGIGTLFSLAVVLSLAAALLTMAPALSSGTAIVRQAARAVPLWRRPVSEPQPCQEG